MFYQYRHIAFLKGFVSGILICIFLVMAGLIWISKQGITVYLDSEDIANAVKEQIIVETGNKLSLIIEEAKEEIPKIVEEQMEGNLRSDHMEIAGFKFKLPEEFLIQLEKTLQRNVTVTTLRLLDQINTKLLFKKFGDTVYVFVKDALEKELNGKVITVKPFDYFSLPVQVMVK